jgi:ABC-2 type transport system permease protein
MLDIAMSEVAQTFRNRSILITSFFMPAAASAFFVWRREVFESIGQGFIAALVVFTIAAFGLYGSAVTSLAARRQNLFLKRLRSTAASDAEILIGMILPAAVLAAIQMAVILVVLSAVTGRPTDVVPLAVGALLVLAMMIGLGLATAGVTRSPEHAQVTTLPISLGVIVIVNWVAITGSEELTALKRLLPGGAATELLTRSWDGGVAWADVLILIAPTLAWVALSGALALKYFQWEPRR